MRLSVKYEDERSFISKAALLRGFDTAWMTYVTGGGKIVVGKYILICQTMK